MVIHRFDDLILFGQEGGVNPWLFSINGFDAGNGVGQPVTDDAEADGNFIGVQPSGGQISGTLRLQGSTGFF